MSQPFDLDAAVGENTSEPFVFTWGGEQFQLPPAMSLPVDRLLKILDAIDGIEDATPDGIADVLKLLIDDEMLRRLSAAKPLSVVGLMRLVQAWIAHEGPSLGKSPASSVSSASTAPRSRPTSRSGRGRKTS